ncbi:MAG: Spx/MgsR family RNA polymerase-binding regulatory protein [Alicyclobacillus sp.]|nr:Spx/MgsR family RNA polymerase-binding regulatory protein [Alicyclobacillus sp.]
MRFFGYQRCSTCRNAYKHLTSAGLELAFEDFVQSPPDVDTLRRWVHRLGGEVTPLLNTKGRRFKELGLAPDSFDTEGWLRALSEDGRLLKRPVLELDDRVVVGYRADAYDELIRENAR